MEGGAYIALGGGFVSLVLAARASKLHSEEIGTPGQSLFSWRVLPWVAWLALVGISIVNPSHEPENKELVRDPSTLVDATGEPDALGLANPSIAREHLEWLPATADPGRSSYYGAGIAGVMAFAMALVVMPMTRRQVRLWLGIVYANSLLLTLVGLFFHFQDKTRMFGRFWAGNQMPFAGFAYKNIWVAYAILSAVIGIGLAVRGYRAGQSFTSAKSSTAFFAFSVPLILLSFPLLQSRAGLLLTALLAIWVAIAVLRNLLNVHEAQRSWSKLGATSFALIVLAWFMWSTSGPQLQRMFKKSETQVEMVTADEPTGRMVLIRDTLEMTKVKPWFGWGLATYSQVYPVFQSPELFRKVTFGVDDFAWFPSYYEFAHCDWIQYAAETGWIGLLLLVATPILWTIHYQRNGRDNPISHWLGSGCVLISFLALFEFPFGSEAVMLLFAACLAFAGKYAILEQEARRRRRRSSKSTRSEVAELA